MIDTTNPPPSASQVLKTLMQVAGDGEALKAYLQSHLDDAVIGMVMPYVGLNKADTISRLHGLFAMARGGSASLLAVVAERNSACGRVLLTSVKHDIATLKTLNTRTQKVFEGSLWLNLTPEGQIGVLGVVGDRLSPALAGGMVLLPPQKTPALATA